MYESLIGHELVLNRLIARMTVSPVGVYLFYGPSSVGKRTVAQASARYMMCESQGAFDCTCRSCKRQNDHPDFLVFGRTERVKIADIDHILKFSETVPFIAKNKVVIIDNAHNTTWDASNRLLKLLEEPPPKFSVFIVSDKPDKIIPTITSRCVGYKFGCLSKEDSTKVLQKKMGFKKSDAKILGSLAYETDIDIFSNAGKYLKYRMLVVDFFSNIKKRKLIDSLDYIDKIEKKDIYIFCDLLVLVLTDIILIKNGVFVITNEDLVKKLTEIGSTLNARAVFAIVSSFSQLKKDQILNVNIKMVLKSAIIKNYPLFMVKI